MRTLRALTQILTISLTIALITLAWRGSISWWLVIAIYAWIILFGAHMNSLGAAGRNGLPGASGRIDPPVGPES